MKWITGTAFKTSNYWGAWFRVFGYGLVITTMEPMFSERNGYQKYYFRVFRVKIQLLTPPKRGTSQ